MTNSLNNAQISPATSALRLIPQLAPAPSGVLIEKQAVQRCGGGGGGGGGGGKGGENSNYTVINTHCVAGAVFQTEL